VIPVINRVFYLNYFENSGVAFEILQKNTWLFLLITSILIIIATYFVLKDTNISNAARLGKALIIGGLIGNLMDRVIYGFIIDFIDIFECPVFNLADISIVLGICILLYSILFNKHRTNI
jgi:signal peptidase II